MKQAYAPNRLSIELTSQETDTNINFVYDTTATVELITKIKGVARIGCDSVQPYLKDTIIGTDTLMLFGGWAKKQFLHDTIVRGETVLVKDTLVSGKDSIILTKNFEGQVWRSLYFEPMREDTADTSALIFPLVWQLKKISGGNTVRIPDNEDDAPYNYYTILKEKGTFKSDTIYDRADTIHYGIHRLFWFPDSILSYAPTGDSWYLEINTLYPILNPQDTVFYFAYGDRYYSLKGLGSDARLRLAAGVYPNNINFFSVILCPRQGLIYKNAPFKLRVWQMPVRVNEGLPLILPKPSDFGRGYKGVSPLQGGGEK
jgi:hypothetical protein